MELVGCSPTASIQCSDNHNDMPLITRNTFPPGGFPFDQKKADGSIKKFEGLTYGFWEQVMEIKAYREGNNLMPTDKNAIAEELDAFQCERLGFDPLWVSTQKKMPFSATQFSPSHLLRSAVALAAGANILKDWLGEGSIPVAQELAQKRADICIACPENQESHGIMKWTTAIANAVHQQRREKLRMALRVNGEEKLFGCRICLCHNPLAIWVPMSVIQERTSEETFADFPSNCWKPAERVDKPKAV